MRKVFLIVLLVLGACSGQQALTPQEGELPVFDVDAFSTRLEASQRPMVVNVWASWCLPCRSEAPLFSAAHARFSDQVEFIGIDIQDTQTGAAEFLAEFGLPYENLFDPNAQIRSILGGQGVPVTYFVAPGGALVSTHFGIIDEGQLALAIDELVVSTAG